MLAFWFLFLSSRYALSSSNFPATATFPATRATVGTERSVAPAAEVTVSPPAAVKAAVAPAGMKRGCAEAESRQTARVKTYKP